MAQDILLDVPFEVSAELNRELLLMLLLSGTEMGQSSHGLRSYMNFILLPYVASGSDTK